MSISENGKTLASFEYHNNGQIAKAVRESGTETFAWDGLALIERNGTKYINEPHAGGGNPVLAISGENADAIFNDILGTSLGVAKDGGYSAIDKTSFGADSTDKSSFFTGKPYVEDLGYAFLLRNYRADLGKWQMRDLIGYPDGWNNLAYCNNDIANAFDLFGATICYSGTDPYVSNVVQNVITYYREKAPNSPVNNFINDPYKSIYVYSTKVNTTNPELKGTSNKFDPSPDKYHYDLPTISIDLEHNLNQNYSVYNENNEIIKSGVSVESIFIHELRHAYDFYYDPNFSYLSKYDRNELERRAIEEANNYRKLNNEPLRACYE